MATDAAIENTSHENQTGNNPVQTEASNTENPLVYDGKGGQIFQLWLMNFLLKIITLGIYSFWGKTRLRKYIYGSFSLGGDRFEYTGTGGELFKGFLKVLPILVILFAPIAFLSEQYPAVTILYLPLFYLFGVAIYSAMRYRFSRTRWRGIRGRLGGSAFKYANISASRSVINVITLGFAIPHSDIARNKYMYGNMYFGNVKAEYNGNAKNIYGEYIKSLFIMLGALIIPVTFFAIPIILEAIQSAPPPSVDLSTNGPKTFGQIAEETNQSISILPAIIASISYLLGILSVIFIIPISRSMYTAALMRENMRALNVGDLRFKSKVTTWSLLKHQVGNVLWLVLTLGLATPLVMQRKAKFMAVNTVIYGDLDTSQVMQGKDEGITSGEGLEDALDIDAGFI